MKKNEKNVEVEVVEDEVVEIEEEAESKGFLSKVGTGLKKHGKRIMLIGAGVLVGLALGKRSKNDSDSAENYDDDDDDDNIDIVDDSEIDSEE